MASRKVRTAGVSVVKTGREGWVLKWFEASRDGGKRRQRALTADEAKNATTRDTVRREKAAELEQRRAELATGALPRSGRMLAAALGELLSVLELEKRPKTMKEYRNVAEPFLGFMGPRATIDDVTAAKLSDFADVRKKLPKRVAKAGGKRGETVELECFRDPDTIHKEFRTLTTLLMYLVERGLLDLNRDRIKGALKKPRLVTERRDYLTAAQCRKLWVRTATLRPRVRAYVWCTLLCGWRAGEGKALKWSGVELKGSGMIRLRADETKSWRPRDIPLVWSPAVRAILGRLPRNGPYVFGGHEPLGDIRKQLVKIDLEELPALRRTCATFLANMAAVPLYAAAERGGHDPDVIRKHYAGLLGDRLGPEVTTLEAAMGLDLSVMHVLPAELCQDLWKRAAKLGAPLRAFIWCSLLCGWRPHEGKRLRWSDVNLTGAGSIRLRDTLRPRTVSLRWSPSVRTILAQLPRQGPYVFGGESPLQSVDRAVATTRAGDLLTLRRTCTAFLASLPGMSPTKAAYRSGHHPRVLTTRHLGLPKDLPANCNTLEKAMALDMNVLSPP